MQSRSYRQHYGEVEERPLGRLMAARSQHVENTGKDSNRDIFMHGGRCMSFEVYLAIPTFIRRGLCIME